MICQIITSSHGHQLKDYKILTSNEYACSTCSVGKLITKPSKSKVANESPKILENIQGYICGPIHSSC